MKLKFMNFLLILHKKTSSSSLLKSDANNIFEAGKGESFHPHISGSILLKASSEYLRNYLDPKMSLADVYLRILFW